MGAEVNIFLAWRPHNTHSSRVSIHPPACIIGRMVYSAGLGGNDFPRAFLLSQPRPQFEVDVLRGDLLARKDGGHSVMREQCKNKEDQKRKKH